MPYASCQSCHYRCRVSDTLLGKLIRCPKCSEVVRVVSQLTEQPQEVLQTEADSAPEIPNLYVGKLSARRGPITFTQLQLLARWNLVDVNALISDYEALNCNTVRKFLETGRWYDPNETENSPKPPSVGNSDSPARSSTPPTTRTPRNSQPAIDPRHSQPAIDPRNSAAATGPRHSQSAAGPRNSPAIPGPRTSPTPRAFQTPASPQTESTSPARRAREANYSSPLRSMPPNVPVTASEADKVDDGLGRSMMPDEFTALLDHAVQLERQSKTVKIDRVRTAEVRQVHGDAARFVRSYRFASGLSWIGIVYIVNAIVFCLLSTSTLGMFFKRLLSLSASVFIPFEQTAEIIEGEPLFRCGCAFVLICGQMILPLWLLMREGCVIWHCIGATVLGLILGMAMKPEFLEVIFRIMQVTLFLSGIAVSGIALWMLSDSTAGTCSVRILISVCIAAVSLLLLATVDVDQLMIVRMQELSPQISGSGLHVAIFAGSLLLITVAVPFAIGSILYHESTLSVRQFLDRNLLVLIILATVGGVSVLCFVFPQPANFINVPVALLPLACGNMLVVVTPATLWLLDPAYSLPR